MVLIPRMDPVKYQKVKLLGVEAGGIWIESQDVTNATLKHLGLSSLPTTIVIFFPYHEIAFAVRSIDKIALDEQAFGL